MLKLDKSKVLDDQRAFRYNIKIILKVELKMKV